LLVGQVGAGSDRSPRAYQLSILAQRLGTAIIETDHGGALYTQVSLLLSADEVAQASLQDQAAWAVERLTAAVEPQYAKYTRVVEHEYKDFLYFTAHAGSALDQKQFTAAWDAFVENNPTAVTEVTRAYQQMGEQTIDPASRLAWFEDEWVKAGKPGDTVLAANKLLGTTLKAAGEHEAVRAVITSQAETAAAALLAGEYPSSARGPTSPGSPAEFVVGNSARIATWAIPAGITAFHVRGSVIPASELPATAVALRDAFWRNRYYVPSPTLAASNPVRPGAPLGIGFRAAGALLNFGFGVISVANAIHALKVEDYGAAATHGGMTVLQTLITAMNAGGLATRFFPGSPMTAILASSRVAQSAYLALPAVAVINTAQVLADPYRRQSPRELTMAGVSLAGGGFSGAAALGWITLPALAAYAAAPTLTVTAYAANEAWKRGEFISQIENSDTLRAMLQAIGIEEHHVGALMNIGDPHGWNPLDTRSPLDRLALLADEFKVDLATFVNKMSADQLDVSLALAFQIDEVDGKLLRKNPPGDDQLVMKRLVQQVPPRLLRPSGSSSQASPAGWQDWLAGSLGSMLQNAPFIAPAVSLQSVKLALDATVVADLYPPVDTTAQARPQP
jgi:hypothetical protein